MNHSENIIIKTEGLSKQYNSVRALAPLDLTVPKHAIFGFLGPNGAGKTTTMKLLLGLAQPTGGRGTIFGHDIVAENLAIRARIGYLPQQPRFYEHMTSRETLRFTAAFFFKGPQAKIEERVDEMLHLVGLAEKADRPIKGFSGGERQRLGLAQAQINYPDLLILDEPAAALDPLGRRDVLNIMAKLRHHATIFYSTHILDDVQQVSDTVAILNNGRLVAQGPIETLLAGDGNVIYTVTTKGNEQNGVHQRLSRQPWVAQVATVSHDNTTRWQVSVTDEETAESQLLRLMLADPQLVVIDFGRKKYELEEVFVDLIEGENHEQQ